MDAVRAAQAMGFDDPVNMVQRLIIHTQHGKMIPVTTKTFDKSSELIIRAITKRWPSPDKC